MVWKDIENLPLKTCFFFLFDKERDDPSSTLTGPSWACKQNSISLGADDDPILNAVLRFQGGTSFIDHLCYLCLAFVVLLHLFIAALWSPAGKGPPSWPSFVMFNCVLSLSHVVSWIRCGA